MPASNTPAKRGRPPKPKEVAADNVEQAGTEIVKTKNKSRGLSGVEQNTSAKAEDVSRILANCLQWYKMPKVKNEQELEERIGQFFVECINTGQIPTVEKMCLAIGYDRQTVWRWENGERSSELGPRAGDVTKKGKEFLATFEAEMVTEGKINPVVYIFRAKNFFGMKDVQDYVLTPNNAMGAESDPTQMAQKYQKALPGASIDAEGAEEE